jgi:uncharacterized protein
MNKTIIQRLKPNQDLKLAIIQIAKENNIPAGCIINAVGSLKKATLRTNVVNGKPIIKILKKDFEIVSMIGTICKDGSHEHIHISCADEDGNVFGGHLMEGCIVKTTVELMILEFSEYIFSVEEDEETGFKELVVKNSQPFLQHSTFPRQETSQRSESLQRPESLQGPKTFPRPTSFPRMRESPIKTGIRNKLIFK